jgi:hypothetical protein
MGSEGLLVVCVLIACFITVAIGFSTAIRIVPENKRLMVYRLGRYIGDKGPGIVMLIPMIDRGNEKELGTADLTSTGPGALHVRRMLGWGAETTTSVFRDGGKVLLENGESVDAISEMPVPAGKPVRVKRVIVEVESVE